MSKFRIFKKEGKLYWLLNDRQLFSIRLHSYPVYSPASVENYLQNRKEAPNEGVVYTCIVNDYDTLRQHHYLDPAWDYVCFTDNTELLALGRYGAWEIRPLVHIDSNATLTNRWHKVFPHLLFTQYKKSIYLDGNINILDHMFFRNITRTKEFILLQKHYQRKCIYEEAKAIVYHQKDSHENVERMINFLQKNNMPPNYGLNENGIIYRHHSHDRCIELMQAWWDFIKNYIQRDQMSLSYLLWKRGIKVSSISSRHYRYDNKYVDVMWGHDSITNNYTVEINKIPHPKISFFTYGTPAIGSTRLRVFSVCAALQKRNVNISINDNWRNSDIIIFQKSLPIEDLKRAFKKAKNKNKFVCFDIDDYFTAYNYFIKNADCVIVSTEYLKTVFLPLNKNIFVVENPLDIDDISIPPKTSFNQPYKIGWFGYSCNNYVLKDFKLNNIIEISDTGNIPYNIDSIDENLKSLDLIVIPQHKKPETLGKTHCRMLKALYLGVPVLVSDMPEYRRLAQLLDYNKNMIVPDHKDWNEYIERIRTQNLQFDISTLRRKILSHYSKDKIAEIYYNTVIDAFNAHNAHSYVFKLYKHIKFRLNFRQKNKHWPFKKIRKNDGTRIISLFGIRFLKYTKDI